MGRRGVGLALALALCAAGLVYATSSEASLAITPAASPATTPAASPAASPVASPAASLVALPAAAIDATDAEPLVALARTVRRTSSSIERFLQLVSGARGDGRSALPLLVLPLPVDRDGYERDSEEYEERAPAPRRRITVERRRPAEYDDDEPPRRRAGPRIQRPDDRADGEKVFLVPRREFERQFARPGQDEQTYLVRNPNRGRPADDSRRPSARPVSPFDLDSDKGEQTFLVRNPNRGQQQDDYRRPSAKPVSPYALESDPRDQPGPPRRIPVRPLDRVSSRPVSPFDLEPENRVLPRIPDRGQPQQGLELPFDSQRDPLAGRPRQRVRPAERPRPLYVNPKPFELPLLVPDEPPRRRVRPGDVSRAPDRSPLNFAPDTNERAPSVHASSQHLVDLFRGQAPVAPHLPPAIFGIDEPQDDVQARRYLPPVPAPRVSPPRPRFKRSLRLRGALMVPTSDYTEPYTVWWDAKTGAARVDFHESGTSTVRKMMPDGRVQHIEVRPDRVGERDVVRCGVTRPGTLTAADRAPVALPDLELFSFAGFSQDEGNSSRAEVWRHVVQGAAGQLGAARGEALTFTHEMMIRRQPGSDDPMPIKYAVSVDSSVLGAGADGYEHHYMEAREEQPKPGFFDIDLERVCDTREELDPSVPEHMARLEPLREFTQQARDPRHQEAFQRFKTKFNRVYADATEEAVRSTIVLQHTRFVESCNRMGAPFEAEVNYLCDRLEAELALLRGAVFELGADDADGSSFPHGELRADLRSRSSGLSREFDWRPRGAVTHVRNQGSCSSCWAFSVVGAVEGAHFIQTERLVALSEQTLVDCGHTHGTHGCRGTWPKFAFNYVKSRGLPALNEYPYVGKNETCQAPPVPAVTRISASLAVPPNDIDALKWSIRRISPAVVVVDAKPKSFLTYKRGVLRDERCIKGPKKKLNHAVLSVGWGESRGAPHFILKNSWSAAWGDAGYIRVHAPTNTCGHLTTPEVAELHAADVRSGRPAPDRVHDYEDGY